MVPRGSPGLTPAAATQLAAARKRFKDAENYYILGQNERFPEDILEPTWVYMNALEAEWQRLRPMSDRAADARVRLAEHSDAHGRHSAEVTALQTSLAAAMARQALALEAKTKAAAELADYEAALADEAATAEMHRKAEELIHPPPTPEQAPPAPCEDRPATGQMQALLQESATA